MNEKNTSSVEIRTCIAWKPGGMLWGEIEGESKEPGPGWPHAPEP